MATMTATAGWTTEGERAALAELAVDEYRDHGPRGVVIELEAFYRRPLDADELAVVQEAVEAADPGVDWNAPWREIEGRFPAAVR